MDYGKLLGDTWRIVRQRPFLIWLGILAAVGSEALNSYTRLTFGDTLSDPQALLNYDPQPLLTRLEARLTDTSWLTSAALLLIGSLLIIWLVSTIAEGGLIMAVGSQQPQSFAQAVQAGLKLLWRFILVDTVLFFPLFIIALAIILIVFGTFIGVALSIESRTTPVMNTFFLMFACLIPLACLLLPVGVLTFLARIIAFRTAALDDLPTRPTLRHTWQLFKRHLATIFITAVIVIALRTAGGLVSGIVTTPLSALSGSITNSAGFLLIETIITLLSLLIAGALHTYTSALWTNLYIQQLTLSQTGHSHGHTL